MEFTCYLTYLGLQSHIFIKKKGGQMQQCYCSSLAELPNQFTVDLGTGRGGWLDGVTNVGKLQYTNRADTLCFFFYSKGILNVLNEDKYIRSFLHYLRPQQLSFNTDTPFTYQHYLLITQNLTPLKIGLINQNSRIDVFELIFLLMAALTKPSATY